MQGSKSYSAPLRITVRKLVIYDRETNFKDVKDIKEGEVFMGGGSSHDR